MNIPRTALYRAAMAGISAALFGMIWVALADLDRALALAAV